jgi:hypothetical protein
MEKTGAIGSVVAELNALLKEIQEVWPTLGRGTRKERRANAKRMFPRSRLDRAILQNAHNRPLVSKLATLQAALYQNESREAQLRRKTKLVSQFRALTTEGRAQPERRGDRIYTIVSGGGVNSTGKRR